MPDWDRTMIALLLNMLNPVVAIQGLVKIPCLRQSRSDDTDSTAMMEGRLHVTDTWIEIRHGVGSHWGS